MTPEQWRQIEDLYHRASDIDESRRDEFLRDACGGDDLLRREVESLILQTGKDSPLSAPAVDLVREPSTPIESYPSTRLVWWMYGLVASFLTTLILILYLVVWGPREQLGLTAPFSNGAMTVNSVTPDSVSARGGLRPGDRVMSIDGRPIRAVADWTAFTGTLEPGRRHQWVVLREGAQFTLEVIPETDALRGRLEEGYLWYLTHFFIGLALGLLVAWKRPADPVARIGAWFLMTASITFGLPQGWAVPWRELPLPVQLMLWIPQISRFVLEGIFLSFFFLFPRRLFSARWPWFVIWIPVLVTLPWRIAGFNNVIHPDQTSPVPPWILQLGFARTMVYLIVGIIVLGFSYRRILDANEKRRVRVLMFGTAVSGASAIWMILVDSFYGRIWRENSFVLFISITPFNTAVFASFAYAILRHRILDIGVIVRQGLQYALARRFVLGLVPALAVLFVLDLALNSQEPLAQIMSRRGWIYVGLAAFALVIHWKRNEWLTAIDRRFFRERYNAHAVLRNVVDQVRDARSLERVAQRVVNQVETALHPEFVSLMIQETDSSEYHSLAVAPAGAAVTAPSNLSANSKLIGLIRLLGKPLEVLATDSGWLQRQLPQPELDFVRRKRIDLVVPIAGSTAGRQALLILGMKRSEEPYTPDDQELLETIAGSLALLLEPASTSSSQASSSFNECPECGVCYNSAEQTCRHEGAKLVPVSLPLVLGGRYRLERRRGRGGMGTVYEAVDDALNRRVAVKVIRDDLLSSAEATRRFQREARAAAAFSHPNVVTIHDFGVEASRAFLVMELLDGLTLREELEHRKNLEPVRIVQILRDVCGAIEAAHRRQLIHRDLKPENIFLAHNSVKVLDFGVAKFLPVGDGSDATRVTAQTRTGVLVGTIAYMSPEQLAGGEPAPMWDLWALTVVVYEALTGRRPFPFHSSQDWPLAVLSGKFTPLADSLSQSSERWQQFFNQAFASDTAQRPQTAAEFLKRLEHAFLDQNGREVRPEPEAMQTGTAPAAAPFRSARRRLAVLPLKNLSRDAEQDYFVEGTHEALITDLASIKSLGVIARSSVMRFRDTGIPLSDIAEQLKVDLVLSGSVMLAGNRVRITSQLVDTETEENIWAGRYERDLDDVLSLQNEIVTSIARAIRLELTPQEKQRFSRNRPVDPEAYEAYLKGRFHWYKLSREHQDTAFRYFQIALQKDPNLALAYAGIANTWANRGDRGEIPAAIAYREAKAAALKALELDDALAEVHETLGNVKFCYEWDWSGAEAEFHRAIELNPSSADIRLYYSDLLISTNRPDQAESEMRRALELDPLNTFLQCFFAWHLVYRGQYDNAISQLQKILIPEPGFSSAHLGLWGAYYRKHMYDEAIIAATKFFEAIGDTELAKILASEDTHSDYTARMRRAADKLADRGTSVHIPALRVARLYVHAGEKDKAFEWLHKALENRESPLVHIAVGWDWHDLRTDDRFQYVLRQMNLP